MEPVQIISVSMIVFGFLVYFLISKIMTEKAKVQSCIQDCSIYASYIQQPELPGSLTNEGPSFIKWTSEGVQAKQLQDMNPMGAFRLVGSIINGGEIDAHLNEFYFPYQEIQSIRRVVHLRSKQGEGGGQYSHLIEINGKHNQVVYGIESMDVKKLAELINACLYFNQDIQIDKVMMDILIDRKVPRLYASKKLARRLD
ncbi:hypothetical protein NSQ77_12030 [Oceanobacillus sp. FSL K6-2867]|uniref:hypothetical protein n=1 Tax=Oceanobacillus sp. FSL K6-2867 TaxID=2954748 RepID=UPI0030D8C60D